MSFDIDTRIIQERWEFIKNVKNIYRSNKNKIDAMIVDIRDALKSYNNGQLNESDDDILFDPVGEKPFSTGLRDPFKKAREAGFNIPETDKDIDSLAAFLIKKFGKIVSSKLFLVSLVMVLGTTHSSVWNLVDRLSNAAANATYNVVGTYSDKVAIGKDGTVTSTQIRKLLIAKFGNNSAGVKHWMPHDLKYIPLKMETVKREWEGYIRLLAKRNDIRSSDKTPVEYLLHSLQNSGTIEQPVTLANKDCDDWACGFTGHFATTNPYDVPNYRSALSNIHSNKDLSIGAKMGGSSHEFMQTIGHAGIEQQKGLGHMINIFVLDEGDGNASIAFFEPQKGTLYSGSSITDLWTLSW